MILSITEIKHVENILHFLKIPTLALILVTLKSREVFYFYFINRLDVKIFRLSSWKFAHRYCQYTTPASIRIIVFSKVVCSNETRPRGAYKAGHFTLCSRRNTPWWRLTLVQGFVAPWQVRVRGKNSVVCLRSGSLGCSSRFSRDWIAICRDAWYRIVQDRVRFHDIRMEIDFAPWKMEGKSWRLGYLCKTYVKSISMLHVT